LERRFTILVRVPRRRVVLALAALVSVGVAPGCRKAPESQVPKEEPPRASSPKTEAAPRVGITWADPSGLHRISPNSPAQKARYSLPRAADDKEDGELAVFHFGPGQREAIDAAVASWVAAFSDVAPGDVKRTEREINGLDVRTIEIARGTFEPGRTPAGSSPGPKKDYALQGAIVEGQGGAYLFELTGPARTIAAGGPVFAALVDSVRIVHPEH
jgi:hypothetical protein